MQLNRILSDPDYLNYLERYVNKGSKNYSQYSDINETSPEFQVSHKAKSFTVPTLLGDRESFTITLDNPLKELEDFYLPGNKVLFPIHPDTFKIHSASPIQNIKNLELTEKTIISSPTASTRTLFVKEPHRTLYKIASTCKDISFR